DDAYEGYSLNKYQGKVKNINKEKTLDYFGWIVHVDIDSTGMTEQVNQIYRNDLILFICLLLVILSAWQILMRQVLRTIGSIRDAMTDIQSGNLERQIPIEGKHELWALAGQYNDMVTELRRQRKETQQHYQKMIASIEEKNYAERMALESQIDAHFLCNMLTALHYDALDSGNVNLSRLLKQLSEMLHYTLANQGEFTTVGAELKWAEDYLALQKFRRMDLFDYEIHFPQEYSEWPCCKQFFQPFIENSISHGFENMDKGGKIILDGRAEDNYLRLELYDNGCGMSEEVKKSIERIMAGETDVLVFSQTKSGYGVKNVIIRLRMFYGAGLQMRLVTSKGEGTRYIFWLPIPEKLTIDSAEEETGGEEK
ncbi:MAG: histidine kinase, partial [Clostridiales bacterium]|nr:histidine kinase [Clostridiales bacterium]